MTLYVDRLPERNVRDLFEFGASTSEAMGAAFDQALFENPTTALQRMGELDDATQGKPIIGERLPEGVYLPRREPETPLLSADEARARVAESGLDLKIADEGIRQGALDILMQRKRAELERQAILASAPRSSVPLQVLSGFAASAIDPINIASAFVPVVGEARYAAMLARAGSSAARFGVRGGVGAAEGAVGAALVEPIVLAASAQDQADYDMADSLANIAFGTILGGGLHSIGGAAVDALRARQLRRQTTSIDMPTPAGVETVPVDAEQVRAANPLDDSPEAIRSIIARQAEEDIRATADAVAAREVLDSLPAELEPLATVRRLDIADLNAELTEAGRQLSGLDDSFSARAKEFQGEGLTRKQAEQAAREAISQDRATIEGRQAEIQAALAENRQQEQARQALADVRRGVVPAAYQGRVAERAASIRRGVQQRAVASAIRSAREAAAAAPHSVRVAALRTAVSQAMQGRPVDVEDIFRLTSEPESAVESISRKAEVRPLDREGEAASIRADETIRAAGDDEAMILKAAADDEQLAQEVATQTGMAPDLSDANTLAAQAETYSRAWRAYALCALRT